MQPEQTPLSRRLRVIRALAVGTIAVLVLVASAPYNDYLLVNTFMVGSFLPLVVVLTLFFLTVVVNAPLHRFAPRWALSAKELVIILGMMLAAASIPTQGLLRYWLPMLVAPFYMGQSDPEFWKIFTDTSFPTWFFPVTDIAGGRSDPLVTDFYGRVRDGQIPYSAWIVPLAGWGVFFAGWMAAMIGLALLVVPQWARNERLPFPLAQIQAAVIEPPQPRNWFNGLFGARSFWIGLSVVFFIHNINALRPHFPEYIVEIPLQYSFFNIFSEPPWLYLTSFMKSATIYFTFIGVAYFIQSRVAFSLWAIFVLAELFQMQLRVFGTDLPIPARTDQHLGASVAFAAGIVWIGRHHWARVARHLVFGRQSGESQSFRVPAILFLAGTGVMIGWMMWVGMQTWAAVAMAVLVILGHLVVTRIVAETGLPFFRFSGEAQQIFANVPAGAVQAKDVMVAGMAIQTVGPMGTRESLLTFATHAYRIEQEVEPNQPRYRLLTGAMAVAVILAFVVGSFASLRMYYTYATPITLEANPLLNPDGLEHKPRGEVVNPVKDAVAGFPNRSHSTAIHFTTGLAITGTLQALALRFSAWPLMPVGYVTAFTWYMRLGWYSLMIGWLCKVLILRYGGAGMFIRFRPFFIGIIFGEALAAATWLVINGLLAASGHAYYPVNVLPT